MTQAGVLSDTHLTTPSEYYRECVHRAFNDCDIMLHAGDITDAAVLDVFIGKTVYAVHGNMCGKKAISRFPEQQVLTIDGYRIGLCHGAGPGQTILERMGRRFPEVDCIVFGHTHQPFCEEINGVLFLNPGSFQCINPYGAPPCYAVLKIDSSGISASLHTLPQSR